MQLFISPVIARRIISALLIIAGVRSANITQLTGLCERSIRNLKKQLVAGDTDSLFDVKGGRGRKSKFKDVESQIVEEIEKGNYQSLQQIADMICEKFGLNASILYSKACRFVKTFSGRQRYNVLGAVNFMAKKVHTVTNTTYITAAEICQMLQTAASEYAGKKIHIVLDNARYQKCEVVTSLVKALSIDLVYLPPYSPNLNLIERLWKFTKGRLRTKYYSDFVTFKDTIDSIIDGTDTVFKVQVSRLIDEKIQLFDTLTPVCENTFPILGREKNHAA